MEWLETDPLPARCQCCKEADCYNCDFAGDRWQLTREDELRMRLKGLHKAMDRLQRQIQAVETELGLTEQQKS